MAAIAMAATVLAGAAACQQQPQARTTQTVVPAGQVPGSTGSVELSWAPTYMADDTTYTRAEAVSLAKRFNLIGALPTSFSQYVPQMRAANPNLTILAYANATFLWSGYTSGVPEAEFAHDVNGNRIKSNGFDTYLMDPGNPAWRKAATAQCQTRAQDAHYNGCLVDLLTMAVYAPHFVTSLPVNPATGKVYSEQTWRSLLEKLAAQYSVDDPKDLIVGNAVSNAFRYWDSPVRSRPIVMTLPGAQMEDFLRASSDNPDTYPDLAEWRQNVKIITDLEAAHHTALISTKLWTPANPTQIAAWQRFSMASFLLAANGHSYFAFDDGRTKAGAMQVGLPYSMPTALGAPTDSMQLSGSAYTRTFVNGKVIVNPTSHATTVFLGATYKNLEGQTLTTATLPAHTGDIYLGSG